MNDKLTKARIGLITDHPFYATLMLSMSNVMDESIETSCTDGKSIRTNPKFIEPLTLDQVKGLHAHEIMHVALGHHFRRGDRDPKKWNVACDYAINPILKQSGFELPPDGLLNPAYAGMAAEEIYNLLPNGDGKGNNNSAPKGGNGKQQQQPGNGAGKPGHGENFGQVESPQGTQSEIKQTEAQHKQLVAQAAMQAKLAGKLPGDLERLIAEYMEPKVNWKEVLAAFLTDIARNDYSYRMPNKRYIHSGLYLPSLESIEKGKFILMVDTSGSIDAEQLNKTAGEIQSILSESANHVHVLYIDADLHAPEEFESDDIIELHPKGGGGTSFVPGFEYCNEQGIEAKAVIYFTDGYCNDFPPTPDMPVIWVIHDGMKNFKPPFGEVVHINE